MDSLTFCQDILISYHKPCMGLDNKQNHYGTGEECESECEVNSVQGTVCALQALVNYVTDRCLRAPAIHKVYKLYDSVYKQHLQTSYNVDG